MPRNAPVWWTRERKTHQQALCQHVGGEPRGRVHAERLLQAVSAERQRAQPVGKRLCVSSAGDELLHVPQTDEPPFQLLAHDALHGDVQVHRLGGVGDATARYGMARTKR